MVRAEDAEAPEDAVPSGEGGGSVPPEAAGGAQSPETPEQAQAALAAVLQDIDNEVQRRRASGDLPPQLERELDDLFLRYAPEAGGREGGASAVLRQVEAAAFIDPVVPVASEKSGGAALKRTVRSLSLWYMGFVTTQVNQFAAAVTRCLHVLESEVEALQRQVAAIEPGAVPVIEVPSVHAPGAWWVPVALEALQAFCGRRGRVLHAAAGDGWLAQVLIDHDIDAYGVDPRPVPVEAGEDAGLDVRQEDLLEHLGAVAPGALSGIVLSSLVDGMTVGLRHQLLVAVAATLAPDGVLVIHSLAPSAWRAEDAPAAADLAPGQPWRAATWVHVLAEHGLAAQPTAGHRDFVVVARAAEESGRAPGR